MAKWGEIPNMSTEQELIALNKKLISTAKELKALQDNLSKSNLGLSQVVDDNELAIIEIEQSIQALNSIKVKKRRLISLLSGDE
jgi:hypothetical protein